jgi:hypothetical protein
MPECMGPQNVQLARREGEMKSVCAGPSGEGLAGELSFQRTVASIQPPVRAADTPACDRFLLAGPSNSR